MSEIEQKREKQIKMKMQSTPYPSCKLGGGVWESGVAGLESEAT